MRAAALVAALLSTAAACGSDPAPAAVTAPDLPRPRRVLLVVIDATHAAHISSYGGPEGLTPNVDAPAARGRRFDRAFSNHTWTLPSTASLMTGQLQETHGVVSTDRRAPEDATLVTELFAGAGYATAAFVQMVYASDAFGLDQGFEDAVYYHHKAGGEAAPARRIVTDVLCWLDAHVEDDVFVYLHMRRPHSPYDPDPRFLAELAVGHPLADGSRDDLLAHADSRVAARDELSDAEVERVHQLYRANLRTVDEQLESVLEAFGALDGSLVILTSDHGEALGQHGPFGRGPHLTAEAIDIPLIMAGPGIPPAVDVEPASTIDVLPTLVELCDLPVPDDFAPDGRSLARRPSGLPDPEAHRPVALSAKHPGREATALGVVQGDYKFLLTGGEPRLFDRSDDRNDTVDLSDHHPDLVARMTDFVRERQSAYRARRQAGEAPRQLSEEEREALGELGYLR